MPGRGRVGRGRVKEGERERVGEKTGKGSWGGNAEVRREGVREGEKFAIPVLICFRRYWKVTRHSTNVPSL